MHARPLAAAVITGCVAFTACAEEAPVVTDADHLARLDAICAETTEELAALPAPPELISVADFAASAAGLLAAEAEEMRRLDAPAELDDDHRALVLTTDEQAAAWGQLATEANAGETAYDTQRIGELTLGRNDLARDMGADACVRDGL